MSKKETSIDRSIVNQRLSKVETGLEYKSKTKQQNCSRTNTNESKKSFKIPKIDKITLQ